MRITGWLRRLSPAFALLGTTFRAVALGAVSLGIVSLGIVSLGAAPVAAAAPGLSVAPAAVHLWGPAAEHRLQVTFTDDQGWQRDVTAEASYASSNPASVTVAAPGRLRAVGDGSGVVTVSWEGREASVEVSAAETSAQQPVSFQLDVQPILTAVGCNQGACHGKARGQNGFQLSLLGFDSEFDHAALVKQARGRRVTIARPENSLLLLKASGATPHGGGVRLAREGADYATLLRWIEEGAPATPAAGAEERQLESIAVTPQYRRMRPGASQPLLVTAKFSDGRTLDVTDRTSFQSNEAAIVAVDAAGVATAGPLPGEAALMARYMDQIAVAQITIPLPGEVAPEVYAQLPRKNFIDERVWEKLQSLGVTPTELCSDEKFVRRAYLDVLGALPEPEETLAFLHDGDSAKREKLIDALLERPEFADHWAGKWADLLRPNPYRVGIKATLNYDNWIRESFRRNQPYDEFVRDLVTAQGSTWRNGATTLFRDRRTPDELATLFSQLFLGVRLDCAKCHHHPFERWSQDDFYSFAAFFARVGRKGTGLSPPISGGEEMVIVAKSGSVTHPLTGATLAPRPLFGELPEPLEADDDPRVALAAWMTHDNPYFAEVMANRVWGDLMGRGLVDPIDDLRATNPPSNGPLLRELGEHFASQGYNLKALIRTIATSHVYQLRSLPTERNASDTRNHSRHYRQRLSAEVLSEAISGMTGTPFKYSAMPAGSRANQIWTTRVSSLFLDTFGRPDPNQDPPCERTPDTTVIQTLHLMNAPELHAMVVGDAGRAAELAKSEKTPPEIVSELYLRAYCRQPDAEELAVAAALFEGPDASRRRATEDLMWALINTPEFVFSD